MSTVGRQCAVAEIAPDFLAFAHSDPRKSAEKKVTERLLDIIGEGSEIEIRWQVWNRGPLGTWEWEAEKPEWADKVQFPRYRVMAVQK